jgi:uncharacterized SAM-binding protein YcdF (DUF218 family)
MRPRLRGLAARDVVGYEVGVTFASCSSRVDGTSDAMSNGTTRPRHPSGSVAVCVLGCRSGSAALARRARAGRDAFVDRRAALVVACGGLAWGGRVEADEIARILRDGGVPEQAIVRERSSRDTFENARHAAELLDAAGVRKVVLVTCAWHLPRARRLFERAGLDVVDGVGVPPPDPPLLARAWWAARERVAYVKDLVRAARG